MDASGPRERILEAAATLLAESGRDAVSTRAVGAAAGVQAPTLYRLFGDKQGLLDALASHGFEAYLATKTRVEPTDDPVQDLRAGWDLHVGLGLARPELYLLMTDGRPGGSPSPASEAGRAVLARLVHRIAEAGRLRVGEERAALLVHAAGTGTTRALIAQPGPVRDLALSELAREAVLAAITTDAPATGPSGPLPAAVALRAGLPDVTVLTDAERALLQEWLDRIAGRPGSAP